MAIVMTDLGPIRLPDNPAAPSGDDGAPEWWDPELFGDWETTSPALRAAYKAAYDKRAAAAARAARSADGRDNTAAEWRRAVANKEVSYEDAIKGMVETAGYTPQSAAIALAGIKPAGGGGGRGRDPGLARGTDLDNEAKARKLVYDAEDRERRMRLDERGMANDDRNFGVSEEQRAIDNAIREAQFEESKARDRRDFASAEKWRERADYWTNIREERAGQKQQFDMGIESAQQQIRGGDFNLRRNEAMGYVVDPVGTGVDAGTPTASQRQRDFTNTRGIAQDAIGMSEREQARRERAAAFENQLVQQQQQREDAGLDREEQRRQFEARMQTEVAGRARPVRFTPGLVQSRQGY